MKSSAKLVSSKYLKHNRIDTSRPKKDTMKQKPHSPKDSSMTKTFRHFSELKQRRRIEKKITTSDHNV